MAQGRRAEFPWLRNTRIARLSSACSSLLGIFLLVIRADALRLDVFQAKLVVLNAPRYGQQLVGDVSYHVRILSPSMEWVVYSLVFGPNAAKPGAELKTGDAVQLVVDLDQSGFVAGAASSGASFAGAPGSLYVWSWAGLSSADSPDPTGGSAVYYTGGLTPLRLSTVVWVVTDVCGEEVEGGLTAQDVSAALFGPPPGAALSSPGPHAAKHYYPAMPLSRLLHDCSYGNIALKRSSTLVLNLSLPCVGVRPNGAAWNATRGSAGIAGACGHNELWGWMEYALQNARGQVGGVDIAAFRRRILVLPPAPTTTTTTTATGASGGSGSSGSVGPGPLLCPAWQQRGSFGCDQALGCDVWIQGDLRGRPPGQLLLPRLLAQLGSSMALQPAAVSSRPTGPAPLLSSSGQPADPTCPMGSSEEGQGGGGGEGQQDFKCFNGPNAFKLRLARTALRLDAGSNLWEGSPRVVQLPPAALSPTNLLLVLPNWLPIPAANVRPLYGQYRAPVGGDAGLAAAAAGRLVLHSVNSSVPPLGSDAGPGSVLLAALSPGEAFRFEPGQVVVRFRSVTPPAAEDAGGVTGGSATVSVCRYSVVSEAGFDCYDGVDNDCDGLVDFADPDCAAAGGFGFGRR